MKRIISSFILLIILCTTATAQSDIFKKCEKEKSVTTVYVTKAMLQMMTSENASRMDSQALTMLKDKIDNVLIINADKDKGIDFLKSLRNDFANNRKAEMLMQISESNSEMRLYSLPLSDGKIQYLLSVFGGSHATTIVIEGALTLDEISRITQGMTPKPSKKK